jgi:D-alanyl-D-alanine carboxypeptidase
MMGGELIVGPRSRRALIVAAFALGLVLRPSLGTSRARTSTSSTVRPAPPAARLGDHLQSALDSLIAAHPSVPGIALQVSLPGRDFTWSGAAGRVAWGGAERLSPDHPVRIASTTKTYTAAAVLRLAEEGRLGLDDPIARHLSPDTLELLSRDRYDTQRITLRQLLSHTSGVFDYAFGPGSSFAEIVAASPSRRWTRREQVEFAVRSGDPVGLPGGQHHYSDTGYVLLGEVVERRSGKPLGEAYRSLLGFDRLGLRATWLETLEDAPPGARERAHQYWGELDFFTADPSFDLYGGGGLVATVEDMSRFFDALLGGRVFARKATLEAMLTIPAANLEAQSPYALGIHRQAVGARTCWGHGGYWGTLALACPESRMSVAYTVNQNQGTDDLRRALLEKVFELTGAPPP